MNKMFEDIYETVWREIFPGFPMLDIETFQKLFTKDMMLPQKYSCAITNTPIYSSSIYGYKKFISRPEVEKRVNQDNFMEEKKEIGSLKDLLSIMQKQALFRGSRSLNSELVEESDDIYSSSHIYRSLHLYNCQKMLFCNNNKMCEYLLASSGTGESTFGIHILDSGSISNSFDVSWSGKCANSYFLHSCIDVRDSMFCFHLSSKQYCIGNMQFTEKEYTTLKKLLLKEYFDQLKEEGAFTMLASL